MRLRVMAVAMLVTAILVLSAAAAYAHDCVNIMKKPGAGLQAFVANDGKAGFMIRMDGEEVFMHPSKGELPEGAHDSAAWIEVHMPGPME